MTAPTRPLRFAVMLRSYDKLGGVGVYAQNILEHLLRLDERNEYHLFWAKPELAGTLAGRPNVHDHVLPLGSVLRWDQWQAPRLAARLGADVIFNTKFSVPLVTRARTVMVVHGASWFVHPELYPRREVVYARMAMPLYCRRADFIISNSELTTRDFQRLMHVPDHKIRTVLLAAGERFRPVRDPERLEAVRRRYGLPERFVVTVSCYDPRKNFRTLIDAFERCRRQVDVDLVVTGAGCSRYVEDHRLVERNLADHVHFPGWVGQDDLPEMLSLAEALVFPSVYEEFGIPVVEAMACGCPVVSSTTGAIPELTRGAALLSDPFDTDRLAENLLRVLTSEATAAECRERGLERARTFSWEVAARQTLDVLRQVASRNGSSGR